MDANATPDAAKNTVTIINRSRREVVLTLPHDVCCVDGDEVLCTCSRQVHGSVAYSASEGTRRVVGGRKRIAKSITILAGETGKDLPISVLRSPDVQANRAVLSIQEPKAESAEG